MNHFYKKIALGMRLQSGPFGGGNQFGGSFTRYFANKGHSMAYTLHDEDIEAIIVTETRQWLQTCAFDMAEALKYQAAHPHVPIILRVNECDERKDRSLKLLNRLIINSGHHADAIVFISRWLHDLFIQQAPALAAESLVILNGADESIFNDHGYVPWNGTWPLKLVTHHWGGGWNKGFDVYTKLDELIGSTYRDKISFTYIGNLASGVTLKNSRVIPPLPSDAIAKELKNNHVYITAAQYEPAGMHHVEAAQCGLPLMYRNSGALPEYCRDFGIAFTGPEDVEQALTTMMAQYAQWQSQMNQYPNNAQTMCHQYENLLANGVTHSPLDRHSALNRFSLSLLSKTLFWYDHLF